MLYWIFDKFLTLFLYLQYVFLKLVNYYRDNRVYNCRLLLNDNTIVNYSGGLNWDYITQYRKEVKCLEVRYYYKNTLYRIIYEYPKDIIFPLGFDRMSKITYFFSDNYEELFKEYAGPNRDFYNGRFPPKLEHILLLNNIKDDYIKITNNRFEEITFNKDENIVI